MDAQTTDGPPGDQPMSLGAHLVELRRHLLRAIAWLVCGAIVPFVFYEHVFAFLKEPLYRALDDPELITKSLEGTFFVTLKICLAAGVFVGGPFALREMWRFVATGLYDRERRAVTLFAPTSYLLFAAGGAFFYFVIAPVMIRFFVDHSVKQGVRPLIDVSDWFGLFAGMLVVNGLIFQLPLLMFVASRTGIVSWRTFGRYRRHFIVGSVAAAAVLTPTGDALTLGLTMIPILVLFEAGILLCRIAGGASDDEDDGDAKENT